MRKGCAAFMRQLFQLSNIISHMKMFPRDVWQVVLQFMPREELLWIEHRLIYVYNPENVARMLEQKDKNVEEFPPSWEHGIQVTVNALFLGMQCIGIELSYDPLRALRRLGPNIEFCSESFDDCYVPGDPYLTALKIYDEAVIDNNRDDYEEKVDDVMTEYFDWDCNRQMETAPFSPPPTIDQLVALFQ